MKVKDIVSKQYYLDDINLRYHPCIPENILEELKNKYPDYTIESIDFSEIDCYYDKYREGRYFSGYVEVVLFRYVELDKNFDLMKLNSLIINNEHSLF